MSLLQLSISAIVSCSCRPRGMSGFSKTLSATRQGFEISRSKAGPLPVNECGTPGGTGRQSPGIISNCGTVEQYSQLPAGRGKTSRASSCGSASGRSARRKQRGISRNSRPRSRWRPSIRSDRSQRSPSGRNPSTSGSCGGMTSFQFFNCRLNFAQGLCPRGTACGNARPPSSVRPFPCSSSSPFTSWLRRQEQVHRASNSRNPISSQLARPASRRRRSS